MDIQHPNADWRMVFTDGRASGPQRLVVEGTPFFSFMHCRIDGRSCDDMISKRAHHYHRGGCHRFDGEGFFPGEGEIRLEQKVRIAGNTARMDYDVTWPKNTPLKNGLEAGSVVLLGKWERFFVLTPGCDSPEWRAMPQAGEAPISLSPMPAAIVFENDSFQRLEIGLGDDLWRWAKGMNGEYLHGAGRLELSRSGNNFSLRRWVTECDPQQEARIAARLQQKRRKSGEGAGENGGEGDAQLTVPVSQPDARQYRFGSYFAWSAPELEAPCDLANDATLIPVTAGGLDRKALEALGEEPKLRIDLSKLPVPKNARRNGAVNGTPCWEARGTQAIYRRIIRQLAAYSPSGVLVLEGFSPSWCDSGSHVCRRGDIRHWDLTAILDAAAWTRQVLGEDWQIVAPQRGIWQELPSLAALGAESGFRVLPEDEVLEEGGDEE